MYAECDAATGKRRVKQLGTFTTKRDALSHRKAAAEGRVGSEDETLAEYLAGSWLPSKQGRVQGSALDQYAWAVRSHVVPLLGAVRLGDVTAEVIDGFVASLVVAGQSGKPRLGPTSARMVRKVLSMALQEAVERGRLPRNPVALTQAPKRVRTHRRLGWTLDEARTFLAGVADHRLYAAFHLSLVTGLRRGEVLGLRWVDVDLELCQLLVVQRLCVERGRPILKQLKTESSERAVTFGPGTAAVLAAHRERQTAEAAFAGDGGRGAGWCSRPRSAAGSTPTTSAGRWTS